MFEDNKLTQLLGIKYPIIQGGMAGISESRLVSAVSNAGGLGTLGAGLMPDTWLEQEISVHSKQINSKTSNFHAIITNDRRKTISDMGNEILSEISDFLITN